MTLEEKEQKKENKKTEEVSSKDVVEGTLNKVLGFKSDDKKDETIPENKNESKKEKKEFSNFDYIIGILDGILKSGMAEKIYETSVEVKKELEEKKGLKNEKHKSDEENKVEKKEDLIKTSVVERKK